MTWEMIHGNCLEVLADRIGIADNEEGNTVHVITDPPYEAITHEAKGRKSADMRTDGKDELSSLNFDPIDAIRAEVTRKIAAISRGWVLIFCTPEGVARWADEINPHNRLRYHRACIWLKPDSAPQFNAQGPATGYESIVTAWSGKGHKRWNGGGKRGVFTHVCSPPSRVKGRHPTEKPVALMRELVSLFTNPGDLVIDPFAGVGSTGVACRALQRRFIGIELDPTYHAVAVQRIKDTKPEEIMAVERPAIQADMDLGGAE